MTTGLKYSRHFDKSKIWNSATFDLLTNQRFELGQENVKVFTSNFKYSISGRGALY